MDVESITDSVLRWVTSKNDHSDEFLTTLVDATRSQSGNSALDVLTGSLLASVVPTAALFSQIIAQVVDFYLDKAEQREQIVRLAERGANSQIMPFIFESLREFLFCPQEDEGLNEGLRFKSSCEFQFQKKKKKERKTGVLINLSSYLACSGKHNQPRRSGVHPSRDTNTLWPASSMLLMTWVITQISFWDVRIVTNTITGFDLRESRHA
jgi:hypothetical protein